MSHLIRPSPSVSLTPTLSGLKPYSLQYLSLSLTLSLSNSIDAISLFQSQECGHSFLLMDQYKQTAATVMPPNVSGNPCLNSGTRPPSCPGTSHELTPTQDVLEDVFMKGKSPLQKPDKLENVVKKESCRKKLDYPSNDSTKKQYLPEDDYQKYRTNADQHSDKMKAFNEKARIASESGKTEDAKSFWSQKWSRVRVPRAI
ncbi:hypothetical protein L1887_38762 [Cichorium endivia]|nr:hypothetical protein L1887_38762 [Cichorium endivia]